MLIPSLAIAVNVNKRKSGNGQDIVDDRNSAVYFTQGKLEFVVDHCYQANFGNLKYAVAGKTVAFLELDGVKRKFVCSGVEVGHIKVGAPGNRLYDGSWKDVYLSHDGLCIYTCLGGAVQNVIDVKITYWKCV